MSNTARKARICQGCGEWTLPGKVYCPSCAVDREPRPDAQVVAEMEGEVTP
mgnify:CR=1 FL=1